MKNSNHQISDFGTPRYLGDPQNDVESLEESEEKLSVCCGAKWYNEDSDICPDCGEHTEFLTEAEIDKMYNDDIESGV